MTREEAITKIKRKACFGGHNNKHLCQWADEGFGKCEECENYMAINALEQEQKTGHWIEKEGWDGDLYYECSVCGEPFCLIEGTPTDNMYNFCPNCGADMSEVEK